jgi:hypothetical protein
MQEALDPRIDRTLPVGFSLNPKKVAKKIKKAAIPRSDGLNPYEATPIHVGGRRLWGLMPACLGIDRGLAACEGTASGQLVPGRARTARGRGLVARGTSLGLH